MEINLSGSIYQFILTLLRYSKKWIKSSGLNTYINKMYLSDFE